MARSDQRLRIRPFRPEDGPACHAMRHEAFIKVFSRELDANTTAAGATAYDPEAFSRMIGAMDSFVAAKDDVPVGFCTVRYPDAITAELLYVYVDLARLREGIGTRLVRHAEAWIQKYHPGVTSIVLDTAVPRYNQAFYQKLGYAETGRTVCRYPDGEVSAVRLVKKRVAYDAVDRDA